MMMAKSRQEAGVSSGQSEDAALAHVAPGMLTPVKAPWLRLGVVVHEPTVPVDGLLAEFALTLRDRGFQVAGAVQRNNACGGTMGQGCAQEIEFFDLGNRSNFSADRSSGIKLLRKAMREDAELVVISRFAAFEAAAQNVNATMGGGPVQGMPILTSIAGRCVQKWQDAIKPEGAMLSPNLRVLWQWWGPENLYRDLELGVVDCEVKRIVAGTRWIMVETETGAGLAYLPRSPRDLVPQFARLARQGLRNLAQLAASWDPAEMALGIAAINAHYNRFDSQGASGNGTQAFRHCAGQVVVIGAFPGLQGMYPDSSVIEADPRPGEYPLVAMDALLPGCGAVVVNSSALVNRSLPRILRLARNAKAALIGPATPLTPRLFDYGLDVLGGFVVGDAEGLATAIRAGASPKEFLRFGRYIHLRSNAAKGER
jgi:uncharacterized protein (DUF4213/DUF364 family)